MRGISHCGCSESTNNVMDMNTHWKKFRTLYQGAPLGQILLDPAVQPDRMAGLFGATNLPDFFSRLFYTALAIGAVLAVLRLGYAGFMYMTSDIWSNKEKAKGIIQEAVLGLLLLMAVWLILA